MMSVPTTRPTTAGSATATVVHDCDSQPVTADGEVDVEKREKVATVIRVAGQGPQDFPDGGKDAWKVVLGAWLVSFSTWGYINAFGVYQDIYQKNQLASYSPSDISWIGSVQMAMIFWGGLICGKLFDMGYLRPIMAIGSGLVVFSLMMTSLAKTYWQILLAQGFGLGLGLGMIFIPALSCIPHWFRARRGTANGIFNSGSSLGGIVFPIMLNNMSSNPRIGFEWAVRATGFLVLVMLIGANLLLKTRLPPNNNGGPIIDIRVFKDVNYSIFVIGSWFIVFGLYLPFFYLQEYALLKGIDPNLAFYTLAMLNAASVFGRIIPNYLSDTWGALNVLGVACFFSPIIIFTLLALHSAASFIIFALFFGFFSGTYVSSLGPSIATLTVDMRTIGVRLGMFFGCQGFAGLFGTPIDGALMSRQGGRFEGAVIFSGVSVFIGTAIISIARIRHSKVKGTPRV